MLIFVILHNSIIIRFQKYLYLCKYENGQKEKEGRYIDGKLIGKSTTWYESGQKKSEANYKNRKILF